MPTTPETEGYVALTVHDDEGVDPRVDKPAGERIPAVIRIPRFAAATLHLADGSRRVVLTVPSGGNGWRFGFFRASDDAPMFFGPPFTASPGDTYTVTLPPEDEPVWVLTG